MAGNVRSQKTYYVFWHDAEGRVVQDENTYGSKEEAITRVLGICEDENVFGPWYESM